VVFSKEALEFLRADDPDTVEAIAPRMESWNNISLNLRGESVEIDGVGFSSIGRLELLKILQQRAASAGAAPRYETGISSLEQLAGYDLIVGADGLNSLMRRSFEGDFGTSLSYSANKFAWYGTTKRFETLSQTFVQTELGAFNAHHYRYSPEMSTFLVECDLATWNRYGFADKTPEQSKAICERVFAATLGWEVSAFDISAEGKRKALLLAEANGVAINYQVGDLLALNYKVEQFDAIALIYAHFPADIKSKYHRMLDKYLRRDGHIIFEAFSKKHLDYIARNEKVGGPKDIDMLYSIDEIQSDFGNYEIIELAEKEIKLSEGLFHNGAGCVIRFVGRKK